MFSIDTDINLVYIEWVVITIGESSLSWLSTGTVKVAPTWIRKARPSNVTHGRAAGFEQPEAHQQQ